MAAYEYQALDSGGRVVTGLLDAETPRQARSHLRAQGLLPEVVRPVARATSSARPHRRIPPSQLSLATRELATLLGSGLTVEDALSALCGAAGDVRVRTVFTAVRSDVMAGASLANALTAFETTFPDFYRALVHAGEEAGALPRVLEHLADYLDAREALRQKTMLALLYPAVVMCVAVAIVLGLLVWVVPQLVTVFEQSRQALPLLTRGLIAVSGGLGAAWPFLLAIVIAAVFAGRALLRRHAVRRRADHVLLKLPALGPVVAGLDTARFASTLAILVGGGVPLLPALATAGRAMKNVVLREAAEGAAARVREGASLSRALGAAGRFPPLLVHLVASGEKSGELEATLERASRLESQALERRLGVFLTLLEPAMIIVMGAIVLLIVIAILLPIISMNQLVR